MRPYLLDPRPYFAHLPDPRHETRHKLRKLYDILRSVLCAVLSGVEDWVGIDAVAEEKEAWWRGFLDLPNGIPSHDPLSDVLGRIDPAAFRAAFTAWATAALPGLREEQICLDGKAVRESQDGTNLAVHWVSVFAGRARWALAPRLRLCNATGDLSRYWSTVTKGWVPSPPLFAAGLNAAAPNLDNSHCCKTALKWDNHSRTY